MRLEGSSCCRALKPAGRPLPHYRGGNGPPSATRRMRGGGAVVDSKNIVCYVNSSACCVYVTSFYSTTSISFYKSFYTLRVFIYFLQLQFCGHFRTSDVSILRLHSSTSLFYAYTHLWVYSGLYSARHLKMSLFYAYTHLWTYSGLHSARRL
jgi:hypothetical protein